MVLLFSPSIRPRTPFKECRASDLIKATERISSTTHPRAESIFETWQREKIPMYISSSDCFFVYLLTHFPFSYSMSMCKHDDQSAYIQTNKRRFLRQTSSASRRPFPVLSHSLVHWMSILNFEREKEKKKWKFSSVNNAGWAELFDRQVGAINMKKSVCLRCKGSFLVRLTAIVQRNYRWIGQKERERERKAKKSTWLFLQDERKNGEGGELSSTS